MAMQMIRVEDNKTSTECFMVESGRVGLYLGNKRVGEMKPMNIHSGKH